MKPFIQAMVMACALPCAGLAAEPQERTQLTMDSGRPRTPEQVAVRFEHALLGFRVLPEEQKIEGDATLEFIALDPLPRLVLELDHQLGIERIEIDGAALPPSAWRNPEGRLSIDLPQPLAKGERVRARIVYAGKPRVAQKAPWDGAFVWSKAPDGQPWIATSVQGEGCDLFWPCIDHPQGEPLVVEQRITVPAPLVAAGNGVLLGVDERDGWRTYRWRAQSPNTYAIALNIGPYEELRGEYRSRHGNTIPLHFWHLQGRGPQARELFGEFPLALDFFEQVIGPYPFADEKMGVVETPHLGMEHQTINAYGNDYEKDEYGYDWLLHHEFAHEWFGNQMTNVDWDEMWLHEGFGSYMQPLYLQWLRGDMEYHASLLKMRAGVANRFPLVSGKSQVVEAVYSDEIGPGHDIYFKGAWILHTLRGLIGDEAFFTSVRRLVYGRDDPAPGNFQPRYASTREFVDIVNDVTGRDYDWFFDVYVYRPALPQLLAERDATSLRLRWKTPDDLPFPMPVDVRVGGRVVTVPMDGGQGHVELPADTHYTLDPHSKLLRDLPHIDAYREDAAARAKAAREKAGEEK
ncbi:M1 family metallopeptidase [Luteimonas marina]|nr:M1 family metallopeptidase [Luteimonas marina]